MTDEELMREAESLRGNICRMLVTDDEKELLQMYEMAEIRLQRIHKERVKEFDKAERKEE